MIGVAKIFGKGRIEAVLSGAGARIGLSSGQTYTVATGAVVALALAVAGLPPVLRGVPGQALAHLPRPSAIVEEVASSSPPDTSIPTTTTPMVTPAPVTALPAEPTPTSAAAPDPAPPPTSIAPPPDPHTVALFADFEHAGTPGAIAVAPDGTVYVTSDDAAPGGSWVVALDPSGEVVDSWQVTGQPAGRKRGLAGVDVDGETVVVVDASRSRLLFLNPATGAIDSGPAIPDVPACLLGVIPAPCEPGVLSMPPDLTGVATAPGGGAYFVSDRGQGIVWRVKGNSVRPFASFDDRLPGEGPVGVSVDRYGDLIVPVTGRLLALPPGLAGIYVVRVIRGHAATPRLQIELTSGQAPSDLVVGDSGRAYVTLPSRDRILDIGLDSGDRLSVRPGDPPFVRPTAITLVDGDLVVAGRARSGGRWVLHTISVLDRPAEHS